MYNAQQSSTGSLYYITFATEKLQRLDPDPLHPVLFIRAIHSTFTILTFYASFFVVSFLTSGFPRKYLPRALDNSIIAGSISFLIISATQS
jgi:hypothetical protein